MYFPTSKTTTSIFFFLLAATAKASPTTAQACDDKITDQLAAGEISLPSGVDAEQLRSCAEHPLKMSPNVNKRSASTDEEGEGAGILSKRDCWYGKPVGCTDGYCWKSCGSSGSGAWCWSARNNGFGDWYTCKSDNDCNDDMACGQAVGGDCDACGCSC